MYLKQKYMSYVNVYFMYRSRDYRVEHIRHMGMCTSRCKTLSKNVNLNTKVQEFVQKIHPSEWKI